MAFLFMSMLKLPRLGQVDRRKWTKGNRFRLDCSSNSLYLFNPLFTQA